MKNTPALSIAARSAAGVFAQGAWNDPDGSLLSLTRAYDLCPQLRAGREASQAMRIHGDNKLSRLSTCIAAAQSFNLQANEAQQLIEQLISSIEQHWPAVADEAELSNNDRKLFRKRLLFPDGVYDQ